MGDMDEVQIVHSYGLIVNVKWILNYEHGTGNTNWILEMFLIIFSIVELELPKLTKYNSSTEYNYDTTSSYLPIGLKHYIWPEATNEDCLASHIKHTELLKIQ